LLLSSVGSDKFDIPHDVCLIFNQLNITIAHCGCRDILFLPDVLKKKKFLYYDLCGNSEPTGQLENIYRAIREYLQGN
jgi:hypothetical protein